MWARINADLYRGLRAVLLGDYEWGARLLGAGHVKLAANDTSALRVLMFAVLRIWHAMTSMFGWRRKTHRLASQA